MVDESMFSKGISQIATGLIGSSNWSGAFSESEILSNFADNESPLGPSESVRQYIRSLSSGEMEDLVARYPENQPFELRQKIAFKFGIAPERVVLGPGAMSLLRSILNLFAIPGNRLLVPIGSFSQFHVAAEFVRLPHEFLGSDPMHIDAEEMVAAAKGDKVIMIVANPSNPAGQLLSLSTIRRVLENLRDRGRGYLLVDEAYLEFAQQAQASSATSLLEEFDNLIVLKTFSKADGLPGIRLGYAISSVPFAIELARSLPPYSTSSLAVQLGNRAIECDNHRVSVANYVRREREYLRKELQCVGFECSVSEGNFFLLWLSSLDEEREIVRRLREDKIKVKGMSFYGFRPSIRVTPQTHIQNAELVALLKEYKNDLS